MTQDERPGKPGGKWDAWTVIYAVLIAVLLTIAIGALAAALARGFG